MPDQDPDDSAVARRDASTKGLLDFYLKQVQD